MRAEVSAAFTEEPERGLRVPARLLRLASDERLVERARGGSEAAFEAIFDRHHRGILAFCRHMLGSVDEAEDAVQHTFLAAYRELARAGDRQLHLRPWLYTIARNRCITVLRGRRREAAGAVVEPSTEHLAAEVDRRNDLRDLLARRRRAARGAARGAGALRARRHGARRDRRGARVPPGEGEGARVPGAFLADRQPDGARDPVRGDPRADRDAARRVAATDRAAPPPARVPRLPRVPRPGADAAP